MLPGVIWCCPVPFSQGQRPSSWRLVPSCDTGSCRVPGDVPDVCNAFACVQKLGREETRGGGGGSGNRAQAHGSRPVQVRPGETPGSPVARLPASGETPVVEAEQRSPWKGASNRPVRSIKRSLQRRHLHPAEPRAKGEPSPCKQGEGHGRHLGAWSGCPRTLRRMGRGTVGRLPWELERASSAPGPAGSSGSDASPITG